MPRTMYHAMRLAEVQTSRDAIRAARRLKAEWQSFLARADFEFSEDAMSHDLVSIEDAGLEEAQEQPVFGMPTRRTTHDRETLTGGVCELMDWFLDGSGAQLESN